MTVVNVLRVYDASRIIMQPKSHFQLRRLSIKRQLLDDFARQHFPHWMAYRILLGNVRIEKY